MSRKALSPSTGALAAISAAAGGGAPGGGGAGGAERGQGKDDQGDAADRPGQRAVAEYRGLPGPKGPGSLGADGGETRAGHRQVVHAEDGGPEQQGAAPPAGRLARQGPAAGAQGEMTGVLLIRAF